MPDIEFAIGDQGLYTVTFVDDDNPEGVDVSSFTGGTIIFTAKNNLSTQLGSASIINFGTPDNYSAQFQIPTSHSMTVGDASYKDYLAQVKITKSGTERKTFIYSVRIHKKLGVST